MRVADAIDPSSANFLTVDFELHRVEIRMDSNTLKIFNFIFSDRILPVIVHCIVYSNPEVERLADVGVVFRCVIRIAVRLYKLAGLRAPARLLVLIADNLLIVQIRDGNNRAKRALDIVIAVVQSRECQFLAGHRSFGFDQRILWRRLRLDPRKDTVAGLTVLHRNRVGIRRTVDRAGQVKGRILSAYQRIARGAAFYRIGRDIASAVGRVKDFVKRIRLFNRRVFNRNRTSSGRKGRDRQHCRQQHHCQQDGNHSFFHVFFLFL